MLLFLDLFRGHILLSVLAFVLYVGYVGYCSFLVKEPAAEEPEKPDENLPAVVEKQTEISGLLYDVLHLSYKGFDKASAIQTTLDSLYEEDHILYIAYYELDKEKDEYVLQKTAGLSPLKLQERYPSGIGMVGQVATTGDYIFADNLLEKETDPVKRHLLHGMDSLLSIPVKASGGGQHGALYIGFPKADASEQKMNITLFGIAAEKLGNELDKQDTFSYVKQESQLDKLTGLYNRQFFDVVIEREFQKAKERNTSLAYILLDLDYFKQMNDTHGHDFGDKVLVTAANIFKKNVRESDFACRSGGDEFSIIIPKADKASVYPILKRIRAEYSKVVEQEHLYAEKDGKPIKSSLSIGVAVFPHKKATSAKELIKLADLALYHVKESGKDNFCFVK